MTLEQLRIFVAVAEREHVTQAARDIHLTQSAVSAAISTLESTHATRLFDRIGRRIELTEAGRLFLAEARAVLARAAAAEAMLGDLAGLKRGTLRIGASQTVGNYWLPPLMHRYRSAHPGITLELTIGNTEAVAEHVRESRVDIGFIEGEVDDPALSLVPVADDEMVVVAHPALLAGRPDHLTPADLAALPWVFRESGSGTRTILEEALEERGLSLAKLDIVLTLPSNEAVRAAVEAGAGATALSRLVVAAPLETGVLRALEMPLPTRQFCLLRHRERSATRAEREMLRLLGVGAAQA